jgi:hypothetical protein
MTATLGPLVAVLDAFSQGASTRRAACRISGLPQDVVDAAVDHLVRTGRLSLLLLASGCEAGGCGGCPIARAGKGCPTKTAQSSLRASEMELESG